MVVSSTKTNQTQSNEKNTLITNVLDALSVEMKSMALACTELQWLISSLLERAHHPDLPSEIHMLQDIDRIQQTLLDMSALTEIISQPTTGLTLATDDLTSCMKLDSLRTRLLSTERPPLCDDAFSESPTDITWL